MRSAALISPAIEALQAKVEHRRDARLRFAEDVDAGLCADPRSISSEYLYDARGSALFEEICLQPEYYLTRTETALLQRHSRDIAEATGDSTVVELGAGTSRKTRHLLDAQGHVHGAVHYVAVDVSDTALQLGKRQLQQLLPKADLHTLRAHYQDGFSLRPHLGPTTFVLLGSTLGNFDDPELSRFFSRAAAACRPGDHFLLGVDLHKSAEVLEAAYNDQAGVTAAFTLNLFRRMNRELDAGLVEDALQHVAFYNADARQIEIYGEFQQAQRLYIVPLDRAHELAAGERVRTEISRKFEVDRLAPQLAGLGFGIKHAFRDERAWYALLLLERHTDQG